MSECSFAPQRISSKTTDKILRRIGREKITPDDLINFQNEKKRRNDERRQIIDEYESRELTFKPRINLRSQKIEAKLQQNQTLLVDPTTRTRQYSGKKSSESDLNIVEGPALMLESDHPYLHNICEYSTVQIPNAVSYTITFDERTSTEPIHDYIKFYRDDAHVEYWGNNKYCGGYGNSSCNWPGVGDRPPLVIHANKFVVHFKSNGSINDWGFLIKIVPMIRRSSDNDSDANSMKSGKPQISHLGKSYRGKSDLSVDSQTAEGHDVFNRLYSQGIEKAQAQTELLVSKACRCVQARLTLMKNEMMSSKVKLPLKHWEGNHTIIESVKTQAVSDDDNILLMLVDLIVFICT